MSKYDLKFINHACIGFENDEELILTDPWFSGRVFNDSWGLLEDTSLDELNLDKLTTIIYSHEHPDHLHWKTLNDIREKVNQEIMIVFRERTNKNIMNQCKKLGYEYAEIKLNTETLLRDNFTLGLFEAGHDSSIVYRVDGKVILNQNDSRPISHISNMIKSIYSHIDVWFMQFGLAGYYANRDDSVGLERARQTHIDLIEQYYNIYTPSIFVPFASFVYFCKKYNCFLNDVQVTPQDVLERFPQERYSTQLMFKGDSILYENWENRNEENLRKWGDIINGDKYITELKEYTEDDILKEAKKLMLEVENNAPQEVHLELFDNDKSFSIDFSNKRFGFIDKVDDNLLIGRLPMEELFSFLKFPWGADTLNITSCFDKINDGLWRNFLVYRDSLYIR